MDFRKLSRIQVPKGSNNSSEPGNFRDLPSSILDALIPGYSLISNYILTAFGLDISLFVSLAVLLLALTKGGQFAYNRVSRAFRYLFLSSVYVDEHDDLFDMLMDWLAATHASSSRRSVRAKTQKGPKVSDEFDPAAEDALDSDGMFDYNRWAARTPPRYEPYYGDHYLWHHGTFFMFRREKRQTLSLSSALRLGNDGDDDVIQLDCIGRSVEPLRDLLRTVKLWSLQRHRNTTTIRHPTPKDRARFSGAWSRTFNRPSRPMDTVILDNEQKQMIIKDMNEYLHPASPRWYATRGIPYRRGYLFHGPPGTGKTSLSFALAGIFGLDIYVISLQEQTLTESDLMQLFHGLSRRCIVLLEDIDAAGLIREEDNEEEAPSKIVKGRAARSKDGPAHRAKAEDKVEEVKKDEEFTLKDLARELKAVSTARGGGGGRGKASGDSNRPNGTGISLSGLLNAIDGVASHEGRVLIMTTNHPEKLDAALIRPGRIDRRVQFKMAARDQIRELFYRMYTGSEARIPMKMVSEQVSSGDLNGACNSHAEEKSANGKEQLHSEGEGHIASGSSLEELAIEFASRVPDDTFTPAEIQNHLMMYKKEPQTAIDTVEEWMKDAIREKEKTSGLKPEASEETDSED